MQAGMMANVPDPHGLHQAYSKDATARRTVPSAPCQMHDVPPYGLWCIRFDLASKME